MRLAIWNNPLVVTSFLLRMRRGSLYSSVVMYLLLWGMAGMAWWYYVDVKQPDFGKVSPVLIFFMSLLIIQTGLSLILAGIRAASAIKTEVLSKTLDFQRIASISPWDIMIGKLLGEPALAYLLTIATVPIAVFCMIMGVNGVGPLEIFLLYLNILSTTLMFGALGLQHRLNLTSEKASAAVPGFGFVIGIASAASSILASAGGRGWLTTPWSVAVLGLLTPVPTFWGLALGNPWEPGLSLFDRGFKIPFLIMTPVTQIGVALLCVHIMARRLVNPVAPTLSKGTAYFLLIVVDFLILGVLQASVGPNLKLATRISVFCALHIMASFVVMGCVTPNRELLESWAWRWRGRRSWFRDEWLGERSVNTLVLLTCCLLCALGVGLLYVGAGDPQEPNDAHNDWKQMVTMRFTVKEALIVPRLATQIVPLALGLTCLIIFTFGTIYQWMVTVAKRYGASVFILALFLLVALPAIIGAIIEARREQPMVSPMNVALEFSPLIHFIVWCGAPMDFPNPGWIVGLYLVLSLGALVSLRRRLGRIIRRVDSKLAGMKVSRDSAALPQEERFS